MPQKTKVQMCGYADLSERPLTLRGPSQAAGHADGGRADSFNPGYFTGSVTSAKLAWRMLWVTKMRIFNSPSPQLMGRLIATVPVFLLSGVMILSGCKRADDPKTPRTEPKQQIGHETKSDSITFNAHIQPIISEHCYHCHGPDASTRKADLRLDQAASATLDRGGYFAIKPFKPDESEILALIAATDPEDMMPPPEAHKRLRPDEIAKLRQWISEGAVYEGHWAFTVPTRPALPKIENSKSKIRNPIDAFILARLAPAGLTPSPEADRATLIRRVTYDLTGLPPTPAEVAEFVADQSASAYEKVVDRLLASPRYGEHRAHYWLDVARYGDSHGLHSDNERAVWPYRDYVIRSFNQNKPFDQFTRENLAGDMLPAETLDQQLASVYIRLGVSTGEGGTIWQEARVNNQRERVEAFGAAYLGLTTGCAACHDHKFDPLSQKDHYQLTAFFNNLTEKPVNQEKKDWPPSIRLPSPDDRDKYDLWLGKRARMKKQLQQRRDNARSLVEQWLLSGVEKPQAVSSEGLELRLKMNEGRGTALKNHAPRALLQEVIVKGTEPTWGEDTWLWPSLRMETASQISAPGVGDVDTGDAFTSSAWIKLLFERPFPKGKVSGVLWSNRNSATGGSGWEVFFEDTGQIRFGLYADASHSSAVVRSKGDRIGVHEWAHLLVRHDGTGRAAGLTIQINGKPCEVEVLSDGLAGSIQSGFPLELGRRHADGEPMRQTSFQDFRVYRRGLDDAETRRVYAEDYVSEIIAKPVADWSEDELHTVATFYVSERDHVSRDLRTKVSEIDRELANMTEQGPSVMVSEESPQLAYADVLNRGAYSQRKERVRPAVPHFLPQLPANAPRDRRGLAEWLVSPGNPLTARVTVNRMWAEVFGTGIVETTEDFGVVGAMPSHPALLDWLAVEFRESGWDVKAFYRLLVTSATYKQTGKVEPDILEKDPLNRLLARGPRFRMDAEMLRDTMLATSGLLVEKQGGPSVKPYQPPGIWEAVSLPGKDTSIYVQDHGEALYRRSLYTFWKRMAVMPNTGTFDQPVRDTSCTRRQRTNTPLQALAALNDVQWLEAARRLAESLIRDCDNDQARISRLGLLMLGRDWNSREANLIQASLQSLREKYPRGSRDAQELIAIGESQVDTSLAPEQVAIWMMVVSAIQNLDETLNK